MNTSTGQRSLVGLKRDFLNNSSYGVDPFATGRDQVLLINKNDKLFAYFNACPHVEGSPLAWKKNEYLDSDKSNIVCSGHGALFDIETGICSAGPCLGQGLKKINLEVDLMGRVFLILDAPSF